MAGTRCCRNGGQKDKSSWLQGGGFEGGKVLVVHGPVRPSAELEEVLLRQAVVASTGIISFQQSCQAGQGAEILELWQGLEILSDFDYVAIFDADFKPDPDFLVSALGSSRYQRGLFAASAFAKAVA